MRQHSSPPHAPSPKGMVRKNNMAEEITLEITNKILIILSFDCLGSARETRGVADVHLQESLYFGWKYSYSCISHFKRTSIRRIAVTESLYFL